MSQSLDEMLREALLNNSYDYDATDKTLTKTWESSFSYLLAAQKAYIGYEELFYYSGDGEDHDGDPEKDDDETRSRFKIGHLYLDNSLYANFDIDYDLVENYCREAYRTSDFYLRPITIEDVVNNRDIFIKMPIVIIDDKVIWDYKLTIWKHHCTFRLPFRRDFVIEDKRKGEDEGLGGDVTYVKHKIQVLIVPTKFYQRYEFSAPMSVDNRKYFGDGSTFTMSAEEMKEKADLNIEEYMEKSVSRLLSDYIAISFGNAPAIRNEVGEINPGWEILIKSLGGIHKEPYENIESKYNGMEFPEFQYMKPKADGSSELVSVNGGKVLEDSIRKARGKMKIPYDDGTMFCSMHFIDEDEDYRLGSMLIPMRYEDGNFVAKIPEDIKMKVLTQDKSVFVSFIYFQELYWHTFFTSANEYGMANDELDAARCFTTSCEYQKDTLPMIVIEKDSYDNAGKLIKVPFNMPVPVENFVIIKKGTEDTPTKLVKNVDMLDLHYPNIYKWRDEEISGYENHYEVGDEYQVFYFYHEDDDHKFNVLFDFYFEYLQELYPEDSTERILNLSRYTNSYYSAKITAGMRPEFREVMDLVIDQYNWESYDYGDMDYIHRYLNLPENKDKVPVQYKIETLKEWIKWDPETLHQYVLEQVKLGASYHLFTRDMDMRERARTNTLLEMGTSMPLEWVYIDPNSKVAYESEKLPDGSYDYKYDEEGNKIEVKPSSARLYVDLGTGTIPDEVYRWQGHRYTPYKEIRYFQNDKGEYETRYVFSFRNDRDYPLMLEARIFVDGIMCVDVYQERKLYMDYFYIPSKYFDVDEEGHCDQFIEVEIFPSFQYEQQIYFETLDDEKTFVIVEPTDFTYEYKEDPLAMYDGKDGKKNHPITEKIQHREDVYLTKEDGIGPFVYAFMKRITNEDGSYTFEDEITPSSDTIYKNLNSPEPYKWYMWDGYRFVYYDESVIHRNIWPTVMDLFYKEDKFQPLRYASEFFDITSIYEEGEYEVKTTDEEKPVVYTRLNKFIVKPNDSEVVGKALTMFFYKIPNGMEVIVDNPDRKDTCYVALEIVENEFAYHRDYMRIFVNGRILPKTKWRFLSTYDCPRVFIVEPLARGDRIYVDVTPYRYTHIYHKDEFIVEGPDDEHCTIDLRGIINKPFDIRYYDVYLNGRKLSLNNVFAITPWTVTFVNMKAKFDLDIFEKERDWEYYGLDYTKQIYHFTYDDLTDSGIVSDEVRRKLVKDMIDRKKDPKLTIYPNTFDEERFDDQIDYDKWADMELFYYYELLPKKYTNPNKRQFDNKILHEDFPYIADTYIVNPVEDALTQREKEMKADHPEVVMLDPDIMLEHEETEGHPYDGTIVTYAVGHILDVYPGDPDEKILKENIEKYVDENIDGEFNQ